MAVNLLALVNRAQGQLGLPKSTGVATPSDDIAAQMFDLAIEAGEDLASEREWSFLIVEGATLSMVAGTGTYSLPSDFDRLVFGTSWDRTNLWETMGPDDPQVARWRRESVAGGIGPRRAIRQVGNTITVWPVPTTTGDLLAYDYVSLNWAVGNGGVNPVAQSTLMLDTDTTVFAPALMVKSLKWRWNAAKGLDATFLKADYDIEVARKAARDKGGGEILTMAPARFDEGNADGIVPGIPSITIGTDTGTNQNVLAVE